MFIKLIFTLNNKTIFMTVPLSTIAYVFMDFINDHFIPLMDKGNPNFALNMYKWQEFTETVIKNLASFKTEDEIKDKVKIIYKIQNNQITENKLDDKLSNQTNDKQSPQSQQSDQSPGSRQEENNKQKKDNWQKQQPLNFRDRRTSFDQNPSHKQRKKSSELMVKKQQRSNSFHGNGLESDIVVEIPLMFPSAQLNQKARNSIGNARKENEMISFNSISDFHKSRNNIPTGTKQAKEQALVQTQQLKILSKKNIQDYGSSSLTPNRNNSYSSSYIESIKKINIQSRSPKEKGKGLFSEVDNSQDYVDKTSQRMPQVDLMNTSALGNIKKRVSEGSDFVNHSFSSADSFGKFMNSFRKLCNTFESNHQKLLRQDFNNKYINC